MACRPPDEQVVVMIPRCLGDIAGAPNGSAVQLPQDLRRQGRRGSNLRCATPSIKANTNVMLSIRWQIVYCK